MKRSSWLGLFFSLLSVGAVLGACGDESTTLPDTSGEGGGGAGGSRGEGGAGAAGLSGGGQAGAAAGAGGGQGGSASGHAGEGGGVSGGGQAGQGTAGVSGGGQAGESSGGQAGAAGESGGGQAGAGGEQAGGAGGSAGGGAGGSAGGGAGGSAGTGGQKTPVTSCQQAKSTDCFGNPDCADTQLCTNLGTEADPVPCCADGPRGMIADGAACVLSDDCQSGLCVPVDNTHSYCSSTCKDDQDCKAPFGQCIAVFGQSKYDWCFPKS